MNILYAELEHRHFSTNKEIYFLIDNSVLIYKEQNKKALITINGDLDDSQILDLFLDIHRLMYIGFGTHPIIKDIIINNKVEDLSLLLGRYFSDTRFMNQPYIFRIDEKILNQTVINKIREINKYPFRSVEELTSTGYSKVITNHRLTLLAHVIEGINELSDNEIDELKKEICRKYKKEQKEIKGKYITYVYNIINKYFFYYNNLYDCDILKILDFDEFLFIKRINDTRHWGSHLFEVNEDNNIIWDGTESIYFFEIIYFSLRMFWTGKLKIDILEDSVKEFYYTIHDWILFNDNTKCQKDYKSIAYKIHHLINN